MALRKFYRFLRDKPLSLAKVKFWCKTILLVSIFSEIMARMRLYPGTPKPPTTLGAEGCGIVESVVEDVTKLQTGDRVMVFSRYASYATHICTSEDMVMSLPNEF